LEAATVRTIVERGSTLMELTGIGPTGAARLLADIGDTHRFRDKDHFASWNGTTPLDAAQPHPGARVL
jgi:transposase